MEAEPQPLDFSNLRSPLLPPEPLATSPPPTSHKRKVEKLEAGQRPSPPPPLEEVASNQSPVQVKKKKRVGSNSSRERLTKHGFEAEAAEQPVRIPDQWGQESLLKDWIDCSVFDAFLVPGKISSARAALMEERTRAANNHHHSHSHSLSHSHSGGGIVLHNSC